MTENQEKFLRMAVVKALKYDEISKELEVDRKVLSKWWDELKIQREELAEIRDIWKRKCPELYFEEFEDWYRNAERKCFYCQITEQKIQKLWEKNPDLTKRNRGRKLEIERMEPNTPYSKISNLVFSCYWCNNAKTDTFSKDEFIEIGKVIEKIWKKRLQ